MTIRRFRRLVTLWGVLLVGACTAPERAAVTPEAFLQRPFTGSFRTEGLFDHARDNQDPSGKVLTFWGGHTFGESGHTGYDWALPTGHPVLAAAAGTVVDAGVAPPFSCRILGRVVDDQLRVRIAHPSRLQQLASETIITSYEHLSEFHVQVGDKVVAGQELGRSGRSGCSTGPHLHFEVLRPNLNDVSNADDVRPIDPYGWRGLGPDPVAENGMGSVPLWVAGQAPELYRERRLRGRYVPDVEIGISELRVSGVEDAAHPDNEWVKVACNVAYSSEGGKCDVDITGWRVTNRAGDAFVFSEGTMVRSGEPIWLRSGDGPTVPPTFFWGGPVPRWDDTGDCAKLLNLEGRLVHEVAVGSESDRLCETRRRREDSIRRSRDADHHPHDDQSGGSDP